MRSPFLIALSLLVAPLALAQTAGSGEQPVIVVPQGDAAQTQSPPPHASQPADTSDSDAPTQDATPSDATSSDATAPSDETEPAPPKVIVVPQQTGQAPQTNTPEPGRRITIVPVAPESDHPAEPALPPIDGHPRTGSFLSGPGSLAFLLHHTLMGATGGFVTQGIPNNFRFDVGAREEMLAGTLVGAGAGFGVSAWWQFHHWVGKPAAYFGVVNSVVGGMAVGGLMNLTTDDSTALAWSGLLGAELGSWLSIGFGGGDLPVETGVLVASGEGWGAIYAALSLAIIRFSGSSLTTSAALDTLMLAPGIGATLLAFSTTRFHPSMRQILRANIAGAAIGGAVLLLSALVLGHLDIATPYLLAMLSSASTMAIVSVFWAEPPDSPTTGRPGAPAPYRSLW